MDKQIIKDLNFKSKYGIHPTTLKTIIALIAVAGLVFAITAMWYYAI
jgi:hypothetical protein